MTAAAASLSKPRKVGLMMVVATVVTFAGWRDKDSALASNEASSLSPTAGAAMRDTWGAGAIPRCASCASRAVTRAFARAMEKVGFADVMPSSDANLTISALHLPMLANFHPRLPGAGGGVAAKTATASFRISVFIISGLHLTRRVNNGWL